MRETANRMTSHSESPVSHFHWVHLSPLILLRLAFIPPPCSGYNLYFSILAWLMQIISCKTKAPVAKTKAPVTMNRVSWYINPLRILGYTLLYPMKYPYHLIFPSYFLGKAAMFHGEGTFQASRREPLGTLSGTPPTSDVSRMGQ